jgi:hypothetical protein
MLKKLREWSRSIDWVPILAGALVTVLALWFIDNHPSYENDPESYQNPFQYVVGMLSPEGWTALGTIVLAGSTLLLWGVTRTAANAAREAAEALPVVERAYVYPEIVTLGPVEECVRESSVYFLTDPSKADTVTPTTTELTFLIRNYGKTPAIIKSVYAAFGVHPNGAFLGISVSRAVLGEKDATEDLVSKMEIGLTPNQAAGIRIYTEIVCFTGNITFDDIWGNECVTEFFFTWQPDTRRMALQGANTKINQNKDGLS